jgi:hypothetical protein
MLHQIYGHGLLESLLHEDEPVIFGEKRKPAGD